MATLFSQLGYVDEAFSIVESIENHREHSLNLREFAESVFVHDQDRAVTIIRLIVDDRVQIQGLIELAIQGLKLNENEMATSLIKEAWSLIESQKTLNSSSMKVLSSAIDVSLSLGQSELLRRHLISLSNQLNQETYRELLSHYRNQIDSKTLRTSFLLMTFDPMMAPLSVLQWCQSLYRDHQDAVVGDIIKECPQLGLTETLSEF